MFSSVKWRTSISCSSRDEHDIDVRHFTLENIMLDTDAIREQLGYEQLNLWGGSYGTKSVSLYLKRYPERVRSIIVDGVLPARHHQL